MATAARTMNQSARIQKAAPINLADTLQFHIDAIRERKYFALGMMMNMFLGVSDDSAYFQDPVNKHLGPITKVQGLQLDWNQDVYPQIAELQAPGGTRSEQFVFPRGVTAPPKISDPRYRRMNTADPDPPKITQDVRHFASGQIFSRQFNEMFLVLQPVEYIGIRVTSTLLRLFGRTNPANGTKVAFLYSPKKQMGYLVGGLLTFD
jgi:hypothetical protein